MGPKRVRTLTAEALGEMEMPMKSQKRCLTKEDAAVTTKNSRRCTREPGVAHDVGYTRVFSKRKMTEDQERIVDEQVTGEYANECFLLDNEALDAELAPAGYRQNVQKQDTLIWMKGHAAAKLLASHLQGHYRTQLVHLGGHGLVERQ